LVTFTAGPIVSALYGSQYLEAGKVLAVHIWTGIFVFWGVIGGNFYVIEGLSKLAFYRSLCGVVINIFLNLIFIPLWGGTGAALATLIAYSVQAYFSELFSGRTRVLFKLKTKALAGFG
jgi:PST family polysaccharide transporter